MNEPDRLFPVTWRGSASIHTATRCSNGTWPFGVLRVDSGRIEVGALRGRISFTPKSVVELRMFRLPFPSMEVVFRDGGKHAMITFAVLRYGKLKTLLADAGFRITCERVVYTGWDVAERTRKFGLLQSGGD